MFEALTFIPRTMLGRGRIWLRVALMQKKLADHFRVISENKSILK